MKIRNAATALMLSALMLSGSIGAFAQHDDHNDHQQKFVKHNEWHKGAKINNGDWGRGEQVDYRSHHLNAPPSGYEWRQVDGNYVEAAVATGVIASVIIASAAH